MNASGSAQRSRSGGSTGNNFQLGFDAAWEPDVFGRLNAGADASEADARAAQASLDQVQVSLAAEVALNYITLRGQQERLSIARRNLTSQRETLQMTDWRVQVGFLDDIAGVRAGPRRRRADRGAGSAARSQPGAKSPCASGADGPRAGALDSLLASPRAVPQAPDDLVLAIPAETLRQRPDIRQAEERIAAALARVAQADAARYPSFRISGLLGLRALTLGALGDGASVVHSL